MEIRLVVRGDVDVVAPGGDGFVLCGVSPEKMFIGYVVASMQVGEYFRGECDGVDHGGVSSEVGVRESLTGWKRVEMCSVLYA